MTTIPTYPAIVRSGDSTITYAAPTILALASVAGPAFEVRQSLTGVDDDGTVWAPSTTVLQILGIGGRPFMALKFGGPAGTWGRLSAVVNPERFGTWPADDLAATRPSSAGYRAARAWVAAFAHANVAESGR